jgi:hypothetical protein
MQTEVVRRQSRHSAEVARTDRRWLLVWVTIFAGLLGFFAAAHQVYRWTGPHPEVTVFVRRVKHHARWLIPGLKAKPNARPAE